MSQLNAVTLHPNVIVKWLRNEADGFGEDGEIDFQNKLHSMADDIEQMYDPAAYGNPDVVEAVEQSVQSDPPSALASLRLISSDGQILAEWAPVKPAGS